MELDCGYTDESGGLKYSWDIKFSVTWNIMFASKIHSKTNLEIP